MKNVVTTGLRPSSMIALATAWEAAQSDAKRYVVVVLDDDDNATTIGAYAARSTANGQATRNTSDATRAYTVCSRTGGGCVAMSGEYVMGTVEPAADGIEGPSAAPTDDLRRHLDGLASELNEMYEGQQKGPRARALASHLRLAYAALDRIGEPARPEGSADA